MDGNLIICWSYISPNLKRIIESGNLFTDWLNSHPNLKYTREFGKLFGYLYFIELFMPVVFILILWFAAVIAPTGLEPADQVSKMTILTASLFFAVFMHVVIVLAGVGKAVFNVMMERRIMGRSH